MKPNTINARLSDEEKAALQEIAYYMQTSQPPGFPLPTESDAIRYAIIQAAASIKRELREYNGEGTA